MFSLCTFRTTSDIVICFASTIQHNLQYSRGKISNYLGFAYSIFFLLHVPIILLLWLFSYVENFLCSFFLQQIWLQVLPYLSVYFKCKYLSVSVAPWFWKTFFISLWINSAPPSSNGKILCRFLQDFIVSNFKIQYIWIDAFEL